MRSDFHNVVALRNTRFVILEKHAIIPPWIAQRSETVAEQPSDVVGASRFRDSSPVISRESTSNYAIRLRGRLARDGLIKRVEERLTIARKFIRGRPIRTRGDIDRAPRL